MKSNTGPNTIAGKNVGADDESAADFDAPTFDANPTALSFSSIATPTASIATPTASVATPTASPASFVQAAPAPISQAIAAMVSSVAAPATTPAIASVSSSPSTSSSASAAISPVVSTTPAPAWVGKLSTASLAADMAAADVNGTVTYAGLKTLLTDLDTTLANSKTTLTSAEFADLKTIAANLNNGMSTSSYLTSVMNGLVNGSTENSTWTGGAASSTALGNLAVGSSATQLSDLIGKWVLGTDLPSSNVNMTGYSPYQVSYSTSSNAVFGAAGPSMNDINQGYLGDCYLLSSLAEVAEQNAGDITSMFTSNGNNTYGVRFYINGVADYITVNTSLADGGTVFNKATDIWASLAEKAYAQLQAGGDVAGSPIAAGNSWSSMGNGGAPEYALEEITGASAITDFTGNGNSWSKSVYNATFTSDTFSSGNATATVLNTLATDLAVGDDVILSSMTSAKDSSGRSTLIGDHAMSVYGYDSASGMLEIRNPWGTASGQSWDTTFEVSLTTLLADGDTLTVDNAGTGTKPPAPPTLTAQTAAQTWKLGQTVNFSLAANTFTDPQSQKLSYSATLASGAALPSWLTFNGTTGTFTGAVANNTTGLSIKVTATDSSGLSASETFTVATPAPIAPSLTAQTATQTWKLGQAVNFTLAANTFTDPQAEKITYTATLASGAALPSWLTFNTTTGAFTGTVPNTATGLSLKITATDLGGASASETFSVLTPAAPPAVTAATAAQTWKLGQAVNFTLAANTFTDPQAERLAYSATLSSGAPLPSWLTFNSSTGAFSGTVPNTAAGLSIKVTATDTSGLSASEVFAVATPATAPVLVAPTAAQSWTTGQAVNLALAATTFSDPQNETLTYHATQASGAALPTWLTFNGTTDTFSGTAPVAATSLSLKVTATDTSGLSVSEIFAVTVAAARMAGAIASVSGSSSVSSTLASVASVTSPTLASPMH